MKKSNLKIMQMLQGFNSKDVLSAFELFKKDMDSPNTFSGTEEELLNEGWLPANGNVQGKETFRFNDMIWVQAENVRKEQRLSLLQIAAQKAALKNRNSKLSPKEKQSAALKQVDIKCPKCNSKMYKQGVCNGCKEGKQGFKIRLICEENPDHEILL